jgi:hypothetical protein
MAEITMDLVIPLIIGIEPKQEQAQFAIYNVTKMLKQLQIDYQAAWHGEIDLDSD